MVDVRKTPTSSLVGPSFVAKGNNRKKKKDLQSLNEGGIVRFIREKMPILLATVCGEERGHCETHKDIESSCSRQASATAEPNGTFSQLCLELCERTQLSLNQRARCVSVRLRYSEVYDRRNLRTGVTQPHGSESGR